MKNKADFLKASLKFLFVLPGNPAKKRGFVKIQGKIQVHIISFDSLVVKE